MCEMSAMLSSGEARGSIGRLVVTDDEYIDVCFFSRTPSHVLFSVLLSIGDNFNVCRLYRFSAHT